MPALHAMPFGAELRDSGVRFRLWAPAARSVDVLLEGGETHAIAMVPCGDGWFEAVAGDATSGSLYRFRIDGRQTVPDPASRYQPEDAHGPSMVVDPAHYSWAHDAWRGRPWHEAVIYELHVGTFTAQGTFNCVRDRLDHLVGSSARLRWNSCRSRTLLALETGDTTVSCRLPPILPMARPMT